MNNCVIAKDIKVSCHGGDLKSRQKLHQNCRGRGEFDQVNNTFDFCINSSFASLVILNQCVECLEISKTWKNGAM